MSWWRVVLLGAAVLAAACTQSAPSTRDLRPKPCAVLYSVARCQAMTDLVAADVGKNRDDVASVAIVPDAPPGGVHLSAGWHIRLRLALTDGSFVDRLLCGGVVHEPACTDDPRLEVRSAIDPDIADAAPGAGATSITVPALSIPIDHRGTYEIELGDGSRPLAGWTSGDFQFAVAWPDDLALRDAMVMLDLRTNAEHPRPSIAFDVLWFRPGATLELRNVEVR